MGFLLHRGFPSIVEEHPPPKKKHMGVGEGGTRWPQSGRKNNSPSELCCGLTLGPKICLLEKEHKTQYYEETIVTLEGMALGGGHPCIQKPSYSPPAPGSNFGKRGGFPHKLLLKGPGGRGLRGGLGASRTGGDPATHPPFNPPRGGGYIQHHNRNKHRNKQWQEANNLKVWATKNSGSSLKFHPPGIDPGTIRPQDRAVNHSATFLS